MLEDEKKANELMRHELNECRAQLLTCSDGASCVARDNEQRYTLVGMPYDGQEAWLEQDLCRQRMCRTQRQIMA